MERDRFLYLSRADVEAAGVSMREIIDTLEVAFREKGEGRVEMPPKPGIHPGDPDNFIHAMPAYIGALGSAGVKWVSGFPGNKQQGLPYVSGLLTLNDPETGLVLSVMDCTWITAKRTGAATALSAKYLARPDSKTVGILACGVQGRSNLEALSTLFPLEKVYAYDTGVDTRQIYAEQMTLELELEVQPVGSPAEAVRGCDMVVTSGPILKQPHATILAGWVEQGAFAAALDYDSYWSPEALSQFDKICTDDHAQLAYYTEIGFFKQLPPVHADLGELVIGTKTGREKPAERTMAMNLGLALDDMATAILIYRRALERDLGTWLPR
jgi:ornithine cyclodeaminase/alanine dehydrogenase-like protein (mu-crystallin family)